jgi:hypothetical protein
MKPDPIEQLGARLFEAARNEAVPQGAEQRALAAARRALSQKNQGNARLSARRNWTVAAACLAIAATSALLIGPRETSLGISAEPSRQGLAQRTQPTQPGAPSGVRASESIPAASTTAVAKLDASAAPSLAHSAKASLSDELSALKVASSALAAGDAQAALAALDRYDRLLKGQKLRAEATLLKIEALSRAGQTEASSALARRFVEQNPGSPLVDRARSFVHE